MLRSFLETSRLSHCHLAFLAGLSLMESKPTTHLTCTASAVRSLYVPVCWDALLVYYRQWYTCETSIDGRGRDSPALHSRGGRRVSRPVAFRARAQSLQPRQWPWRIRAPIFDSNPLRVPPSRQGATCQFQCQCQC